MLLSLIPFFVIAFATTVVPLVVACLRHERKQALEPIPLHPTAADPMLEEIDWQEIEDFLKRSA